MSLRVRLLITIVATLGALACGMYVFASQMLSRDFTNLERASALEGLHTSRKALDLLIDWQYAKSGDWACWDDCYAYMEDHNDKFIKSNLGPNTLETIKIDEMLFVNTKGDLLHEESNSHVPSRELPAAQLVLSELHLDRLSAIQRNKVGVKGIVILPGSIVLTAARPSLTSSEHGPTHGWIVFVRLLREEEIQQLRDITGQRLTLHRLDKSAFLGNGEISSHASNAIDRDDVRWNDSELHADAVIRDLWNQPALRLTIIKPRASYRQGIASIEYFLLAALVLGASVFYVLERFALTRLARLAEDVARVSQDSTSNEVQVSGDDELSYLASRINEMLAQIKKAESELRQYNESLEITIKERTQEIEHAAFHDRLTGLANRALYLDRVRLALVKAKRTKHRVGILCLDLDNFKLVNESLGHAFGDRLLVAVSERLIGCIRPGDTLARLGGDEFAILLEDLVSIEEATVVANTVIRSLKSPLLIENREAFTAASIGIVFTEDFSSEPELLLRDADTAMYRAKSNGRGGFAMWDESMNDDVMNKLELETDLRRALEQDQMFVEYQPIIDLKTREISGAEALLRWRHPSRGVLSPAIFIPVAEESGLINSIGNWILERACRQALRWKQVFDLPRFSINVNLSAKQLEANDIAERVAIILARTGLPPSALKLEITESVFVADRDAIIDKIECIKQFGVKIALDDFGTGYSSLSRLSDLPIDTLKIDRAFVRLLEDQGDAVGVVEAILSLARSLNLNVTAEGIETEGQLSILQNLGCDTGQGFLFARPLSEPQFAELLCRPGHILLRESIRALEARLAA